MFGKKAWAIGSAVAALLVASSVSAQLPLRYSLSLGAFSNNLNTEATTGPQRLAGLSAGGGASLAYGRLGLGIQYMEGSLSPSGDGAGRDLVEGEAMLSLRTLSWLSLKLGPHIRSFIVDDGTERWLFWEGRIRTEARLGTERLTSSLEIWQVLSADVNTVEPFDKGQGIEGNLNWAVLRTTALVGSRVPHRPQPPW